MPQWIELFELFEETREPRFLAAAREGARAYAQYVWLAPRIPDGDVRVHEDGLAPAYRSGPRFPRIKAAAETVPAWRTSEMGLTSESAPTSKGARGIFLACYAPWMLRIATLTDDSFLHDIARSAIIGRYTSFPGYHLNTARNTAYEKPDFARRGKDELNSATSIHYNHIWPHIALVLDYLVTDAFAKSKGAVDFPGRYAEGYGYLQQKIYGDRPGRVYWTDGLYLWMPRGVVQLDQPELNYIVARGEDLVAVVLTNQSKQSVRAKMSFDSKRVAWRAGAERPSVEIWENNQHTGTLPLAADGRIDVAVGAEGISACVIRGATAQVEFQGELRRDAPPLPSGSVCELGWRGARAVAMSFGPGDLTSAYVYAPDLEREMTRCTLRWRQGGGEFRAATDVSFPFDFTVPVTGDGDVEWFLEVELRDGRKEKSPTGRVKLR